MQRSSFKVGDLVLVQGFSTKRRKDSKYIGLTVVYCGNEING